jgi:hypothetical protein
VRGLPTFPDTYENDTRCISASAARQAHPTNYGSESGLPSSRRSRSFTAGLTARARTPKRARFWPFAGKPAEERDRVLCVREVALPTEEGGFDLLA